MPGTKSNHYKWYILSLAMLSYFLVAGMSRMCMPVLFKDISIDLDLSMLAIGTVWGMDPLAGVLVGLPAGLLADRFGMKYTMAVICIFAGVFGALRGLSENFISMASTMFLFGSVAATVPSVVPKIAAVWFSGRELGRANAALNVILAVGSMVATMCSATLFAVWLGGWRPVMYVIAIPCVLLGFMWWLTAREPAEGELPLRPVTTIPLGEALSKVIHSKEVWIMGYIALCNYGASMGTSGFLPIYLRDIGWSPTAADSAMTVLSGVSCVGVIPMALLSERLGSRKGVLLLGTSIMTLTLFLIPHLGTSGVWLMLIINGFLRSSTFTLLTLMIYEMKSIGRNLSGSAVGLMNTMGMFGAFAAPPIGNSLTGWDIGMPFYFWALLSAVSLPAFFLIRGKTSRWW